jgi:hypothetical protein
VAGLKKFLFLSVVTPHFLSLSFSLWFSGGWSLAWRYISKTFASIPVSVSHWMAHLHKYPGRN